jgi:hypothetical protein
VVVVASKSEYGSLHRNHDAVVRAWSDWLYFVTFNCVRPTLLLVIVVSTQYFAIPKIMNSSVIEDHKGPRTCYNLLPELSSTFSEWFHNRSLPKLETRYSHKVVKDLMNCFSLDKNKLQPKASLDSNKQFSCKLETSNQKPHMYGMIGF